MRPITTHAAERQSERGITRNHIKFCISKGTRTNIPNGDPTNRWRHKYMYRGLHVICDALDGTVVTAFWCATEAEDIAQSIATYNALLKDRYERAAGRKTATKGYTRKQERAGKTESVQVEHTAAGGHAMQ